MRNERDLYRDAGDVARRRPPLRDLLEDPPTLPRWPRCHLHGRHLRIRAIIMPAHDSSPFTRIQPPDPGRAPGTLTAGKETA